MVENAATKLVSIKKYPSENAESLPKQNLEMVSNTFTNYISSRTDQDSPTAKPVVCSTLSEKNQPTQNRLKLETGADMACKTSHTENLPADIDNDSLIRKRNVNWHSPIHKFASIATTTQEKQQQTTPQSISTTSSTRTSHVGENSSMSSGSSSASPGKSVRIDDCVQEFYEDLIKRTMEPSVTLPPESEEAGSMNGRGVPTRRTLGDDDGFESLNGKSSSGEDTNPSLHVAKSQLRLRLNAFDNRRVHNEVNLSETETLYAL